MDTGQRDRLEEIRTEVRRAVGRLRGLERVTIEGYYFNGMSLGQIAASEAVSVNRAVVAHRQALSRLRELLAGFVAKWYGIDAVRNPLCPICTASWREDAEAILDAKTADITWGQVMTRIERATGWRAKSPQALIAHLRKHRTFQPERTDNDHASFAGRACVEVQYLDGPEVEPGTIGEGDGPSDG